MVSALVSAIEWSGFELWPGSLCCVLRLDFHSASLHPGVQMDSRFMLKETGVKRRPHGPLGPV